MYLRYSQFAYTPGQTLYSVYYYHFPLCLIDVLRLSNEGVEPKTSENDELGRKYSNVDKVPPATSFVVTREQRSDSAGFHATLSTEPSQR